MRVGIVGHERAKFTLDGERAAAEVIRELLEPAGRVLVSGGCHLGGVDIWAEVIADRLGRKKIVHLPKVLNWSEGFKPRNLLIAQDSDEVHVIVVDQLPPNWKGLRFGKCYHCNSGTHVKSGACWTAKQAQKLGKQAFWHVIQNRERPKHARGPETA